MNAITILREGFIKAGYNKVYYSITFLESSGEMNVSMADTKEKAYARMRFMYNASKSQPFTVTIR